AEGDEADTRDVSSIIPVDTLLTGAGRFPELIYARRLDPDEDEKEEIRETVLWETLVPYAGPFAENDIGMFRPGEAAADYSAVVEAIGAGRRSANSVNRFLTEEPLEAPKNMIRKSTRVLSLDELEPLDVASRQEMPERPHSERATSPDAEIALGYSEEQAVNEGKRCLQCGLICYSRIQQPRLKQSV
ncbi:MAG: hypothetical protein JRJ85_10145, partial [Deltaproteobacteria bacterium]|nr:hypothetical protein [Deltaproteobacteria bacterium]